MRPTDSARYSLVVFEKTNAVTCSVVGMPGSTAAVVCAVGRYVEGEVPTAHMPGPEEPPYEPVNS